MYTIESLRMVRKLTSKVWLDSSCNKLRIKECQKMPWNKNYQRCQRKEDREVEAARYLQQVKHLQELNSKFKRTRAKKVTKIQIKKVLKNQTVNTGSKKLTKKNCVRLGKSTILYEQAY